jgi:hypothetical protein
VNSFNLGNVLLTDKAAFSILYKKEVLIKKDGVIGRLLFGMELER